MRLIVFSGRRIRLERDSSIVGRLEIQVGDEVIRGDCGFGFAVCFESLANFRFFLSQFSEFTVNVVLINFVNLDALFQ